MTREQAREQTREEAPRPSPLAALTPEGRRALLRGLESERIAPPYGPLSVARSVGEAHSPGVAAELARLHALGMAPAHIAEVLRALDAAPEPTPAALVWSGPDDIGAETRDTGVVMRELFAAAERSILVVGFAVYQGTRIFRALAERMEARPALQVRMCLHIDRPQGSTAPDGELVRAFADRFRTSQWAGPRLPEVYFDPRTLAPHAPGHKRASLHAKVVVADEARALVTSANFTEAAQERNIEVGALLDDPSFARSLVRQIDGLIARGKLARVPGLPQ